MTVSLFSSKAANQNFLHLHRLRNTFVGITAAFRFIFFCLLLLFNVQGYAQTALISAFDGGFENTTSTFTANGWTAVNDNNNKWYVGAAVKYAGTNGAYIDNNGGSTNKYVTNKEYTSHFYRDIIIPSGATNISLSFFLRGSGEISYDRLLVYTAPTTVTPVAGTPAQWTSAFPGATLIYTQSAFYTVFTNQSVSLPNSLAGTSVRLIFTWQNDHNSGTNPPAAIDNISLTYTPCTSPTLTFSTTQSCVGGSTGTITATGSGGQAPYTYSIDGVTYQSGNLFSGLAAGNYTLYIRSSGGCGTSLPVTVNEYAASVGDQTLAASNSWIGHMYEGTNFNTYIGTFTETESFDETFAGNTTCYPVTSSSGSSSIYTETFSARFRMNSTKDGLYTFSLGSDDGSRLYVDGILIYNNWNDHALSSSPSVLMNLSGNSSLVYEYYENSGANEVVFQNPKLILANKLSTNISQTVCSGGTSSTISGDSFGLLPSGLSNGTYQWSYSTTIGGTLTNLVGTSATFKPDLTKAPFNAPGTYYVYRSASVTSTNNTGFASYTATNLSNAATIIIGSTPAVTASSTPTCVGAPYGTGTVTLTGSGGSTPYTYTLNGGSNQAGNTFSALAAGTYTVGVISNAGCTASGSVTVVPYPNSIDDTTAMGTDSWIGHTYSGMNFQNYKGSFTESETFNEGFGGNLNCFTISSGATAPSIYTEQFSVRFKMKSGKKGLYVVDLGSDDGSRLSVDGTLVYNNWTDQAFNTKPGVLISLTGSSVLNYEYYENGAGNKVVFQNLALVLANTLFTNTTQAICAGNSGTAISGDTFGTLPTGLSNAGYQWTYSLSESGARTNIAGATSATLTPDASVAPFNNAGTYYIYRNAVVTSSNNTGLNPYTVSNESNAAIITITAIPNASISYVDAPFCNSISTAESVSVAGTAGGQFTGTSGLIVDAATGAIIPSANAIGNYTVTYTVPATGGCSSFTTTTDVYIGAPGAWSGHVNTDWNNAGNWLCGQIPSSTTDAIIPKYVNNFPTVISNTAEAKDVIVRSGASLVIAGTIKVAGTILNSGSLDISAGTLEMNGSSAQTIAGSMFKNKLIKNLVVSNTSASGLSVSSTANDTLKISGSLSFGSATSKLYTGNNITLVSNNAGTANVGILATGNSIIGNVTVERFINTGTAAGQHGKSWQFLATPVTGQSVKQTWMENGVTTSSYGTQITGAGGTAAGFDAYTATPSMKYYNSQNDTWTGITNTNNPVYGQNGYMLFVRGDRTVTAYNQPANSTVLRTTGTLLTGTLPSISVTADKLQSVGNPYASVVDFTLISKNANIDDLFYVWDPYLSGAYGLGGYQTLSAANGWKPVPGGTVSYPTGIPCTVIESGQAFFVHATSSAQAMNAFAIQNNVLTFTENCKAGAPKAANFARVAGNVPNINAQFFRVSLFTGSGQGAVMADGNSVAFDESYSNNIDGKDAIKLANSGENFGIKRAAKTLSIESRSLLTTTDTIYYSMSNMAQRTYQLRFSPENMQSAGIQAFLLDKFSNTSTPLSLTDSSFVNVTITSNAASAAADRFKVVFRQMNALPVTFISIKATQKDKAVLVEWNVENESEMQQYEVEKSADGATFLQAGMVTPLNKGAASYSWTDTKLFEGNNYYRIKRVSKDGQISYTKIIRVVVGKIATNISVYPNPITDGAIHLRMSNVPAGVYAVNLTNSIGQAIFSGRITHSESNSIETISVRNLAKGIYQLEVIKPDRTLQLISVLY